MKKYFTIIFLFLIQQSYAADYYFSATGSDASIIGTIISPFKTIAKANSVQASGDHILFKGGEIFTGKLLPLAGVSYTSYGGGKATISAFTNVTSWVNIGGNIWESTTPVSTLSNCNVVSVNGLNTAMGRYPNNGYLPYQSFSTNTSITSSSLNSTNWTGAEVVIRKTRWIIDRNPITAHSGATITYTPSSDYPGQNNFGFIIQNDPRTLDTLHEWYYNPSTKKFRIYETATPTNVKISTIDTLVKMIYQDHVTFDNLKFTGAGHSALYAGSCAYLTVTNCDFDFNYNGINSDNWGSQSPGAIINNCTFNHTNNNACYLTNEYSSPTLTNNNFQNTGVLNGMAGSGDQKGIAIYEGGNNALIQNNRITKTGYIGIYYSGTSTKVRNNFLDSACIIKDDGGAIYSYNDTALYKEVSGNTITNTLGNSEGTDDVSGSGNSAFGIYVDGDYASHDSIVNNNINNSGHSGAYLHNPYNITFRGNTIYNSGRASLLIKNDRFNVTVRGLTIKNNIFFVRNLPFTETSLPSVTPYFNNLALIKITLHNDVSSFGIIDSNYYARPINDSLVINVQPAGETYSPGGYLMKTLAQWQNYSGLDMHSKKSPTTITDVNDLRFEYNETALPKIISLPSSFIDVKGAVYNGSITLAPYSSAVLIKNATVDSTLIQLNAALIRITNLETAVKNLQTTINAIQTKIVNLKATTIIQ